MVGAKDDGKKKRGLFGRRKKNEGTPKGKKVFGLFGGKKPQPDDSAPEESSNHRFGKLKIKLTKAELETAKNAFIETLRRTSRPGVGALFNVKVS